MKVNILINQSIKNEDTTMAGSRKYDKGIPQELEPMEDIARRQRAKSEAAERKAKAESEAAERKTKADAELLLPIKDMSDAELKHSVNRIFNEKFRKEIVDDSELTQEIKALKEKIIRDKSLEKLKDVKDLVQLIATARQDRTQTTAIIRLIKDYLSNNDFDLLKEKLSREGGPFSRGLTFFAEFKDPIKQNTDRWKAVIDKKIGDRKEWNVEISKLLSQNHKVDKEEKGERSSYTPESPTGNVQIKITMIMGHLQNEWHNKANMLAQSSTTYESKRITPEQQFNRISEDFENLYLLVKSLAQIKYSDGADTFRREKINVSAFFDQLHRHITLYPAKESVKDIYVAMGKTFYEFAKAHEKLLPKLNEQIRKLGDQCLAAATKMPDKVSSAPRPGAGAGKP